MKASKLKTKRFIQSADIPEDGMNVRIRGIEQTELVGLDGQRRNRGILLFDDGVKGLVLNSTNIDSLIARFGEETDDWVGKKIKLIAPLIDSFGRQVPGIRIAPKGKGK